MIKVPEPSELTNFKLSDYCVPESQKYVDRRGYIYILEDKMFPEFIKVGRTSDCKKRLQCYNSDKPFPTASMTYISDMFENVIEVERRILCYMYDISAPSTLSKEWFMIQHKKQIIDIVTKAEEMEKISKIGIYDEEQHF